MLRLRPTAIGLTPHDIQIAHERLAARVFRERIQVCRGPERSRDEAIVSRTTHLQAPRQAEISESDDDCSSDSSNASKPQPQPATLRHRSLTVSDNSSTSDEYLCPHDDDPYQQTNRPELSREPLPRSPLYQSHSAASPKSSPNLRGQPGTPLRVTSLRHQFSEGAMPQTGQFNGSPSPRQSTMSVQRRNLPPYAQPADSKHMFGEDYFQQQLVKATISHSETVLKAEPSPLEIFGLASWEQWEQQLDWQIGWKRGYPQGYTGPGGTSDVVELERRLRPQIARKLINKEIPWRDGPIEMPGPPAENDNPRQEIELPESMQSLRTRPMRPRSASTARDRSSQLSPVHIPHGRAMAQQHAHRARASQYRSPPSQQYAPPLNQRQLTPIGFSVPGQHISPMNHFTPGAFADSGHSLPAGLMMPYPHMSQFMPHAPYMPTLSRHSSPAPMGPPEPMNHHHTQRRSTPFRQASPLERVSSGSPVSRSASSVSEVMSSAATSRYADRSDTSTTSAPRSSMPTQSIHMPRSRPMSTPYVPTSYERNNQFMTRHSHGQGVPTQRPTPPPAIGHGRPQLPRWQRNQENSEEAAMSALQGEMERVRINEQNRETEGEVMNNTPPHESLMERYLRED